ncbi:MAG TPA: glutathione transferase GstA [Labilithrix sp.]|nr:glutathione transferase GstA [Labilithrix sp.]
MKLYYAPGACSLSPHVALREAGVSFDLVRVDFARGKSLPDGSPYTRINPKGYVPALELNDGRVLTEIAAMVQYIADLKPESGLAPRNGTFERVRLQEWLVYIATELHKGLAPLFSPVANDDYKAAAKERLTHRFGFLEKELGGKSWLLGDDFTVADGYALYAIRAWERVAKVDLQEYPTLAGYRRRVEERPAVRAALEAEGLK